MGLITTSKLDLDHLRCNLTPTPALTHSLFTVKNKQKYISDNLGQLMLGSVGECAPCLPCMSPSCFYFHLCRHSLPDIFSLILRDEEILYKNFGCLLTTVYLIQSPPRAESNLLICRNAHTLTSHTGEWKSGVAAGRFAFKLSVEYSCDWMQLSELGAGIGQHVYS